MLAEYASTVVCCVDQLKSQAISGFANVRRVHKDIVIDGIVGEVLHQLVDVAL